MSLKQSVDSLLKKATDSGDVPGVVAMATSSSLKFDIRADKDVSAKNRERMKSKHCEFHLDRIWSFFTLGKSFSTNC